ncbi:MAG: N-acetylmuramoyl-L-alanine amidase, partial [Pseudomonadota bacterium]
MRMAFQPSPNFNARRHPVDMLVLHYTGMESAEAAIARLKDPAADVSAHYVVHNNPFFAHD